MVRQKKRQTGEQAIGAGETGQPRSPVGVGSPIHDESLAERTLLVGRTVGPSPGSGPSWGKREVQGEPSLAKSWGSPGDANTREDVYGD